MALRRKLSAWKSMTKKNHMKAIELSFLERGRGGREKKRGKGGKKGREEREGKREEMGREEGGKRRVLKDMNHPTEQIYTWRCWKQRVHPFHSHPLPTPSLHSHPHPLPHTISPLTPTPPSPHHTTHLKAW